MNFTRYSYLTHNRLGGYIKKLYQTRARHGLFSGFLVALLGFNSSLAIAQPYFLENAQASEAPAQQVDLTDPETLCSLRESLAETGVKELDTQHAFDKEACKAEEAKRNEKLAQETTDEAAHKALEEEKLQAKVNGLTELTEGTPIAEMAEPIAKQDPEIAALIVGIAKKESSWGEHAPSKGGRDCYNYWGYKGAGERGTGMGYACFESREEAVDAVANRLSHIVEKRHTSSPSSLVTTWKCGASCATHSRESVTKWVSDVSVYYNKVLALN